MAESNLVEVENQPGEYSTEGGKKIRVYKIPGGSLYCVGFTPGGELPEMFQTSFTSVKAAANAVECYLNSKKPILKNREQLRAEGKSFVQVEKAIRKQIIKHGPSADQ